ncbi:MAG: hypothetical protein P4M11_07095 [Candidatus Pacebacteria bacterium]|nr:hypothetical protein [Candidatus Paceibacterota bacterium]
MLGYELRLVDDAQPIYDISSLDRAKLLGEYALDAAAFCAKQNFQLRPRASHRRSSVRESIQRGV